MERLEEDEKDDTRQKEPEFIPDDEIEAAFDAADGFGELVLRLLYDTGCRVGELAALERGDITFKPIRDHLLFELAEMLLVLLGEVRRGRYLTVIYGIAFG